MNSFLSKLYYACACEDSLLSDDLNLATDYIKTGRAEEPRRALVGVLQDDSLDDLVRNFEVYTEEQGFINGFRFGIALAHELAE